MLDNMKKTRRTITFIIYDYTCNRSSIVFNKGFNYCPIKEIDLPFGPHLSQKLLSVVNDFPECAAAIMLRNKAMGS